MNIMKYLLSILILLLSGCPMFAGNSADTLRVESFRYSGPLSFRTPYPVDSTDINKNKPDTLAILDSPMNLENVKNAAVASSFIGNGRNALHLASFDIENKTFAKASIKIEGVENYRLYLDGKKVSGNDLILEPATHVLVLKVLSDGKDTPGISVISSESSKLNIKTDTGRLFSLDINSNGEGISALRISPSGKYVFLGITTVLPGGKHENRYEVRNTGDNSLVCRPGSSISWMRDRDEFYYTRKTAEGRDLVCENPATGSITTIAKNIPEGEFSISPKADYLIYHLTQEGPKEGEVHQILTPDDRQPGWRDRSYISMYDIASGVMSQLTFGYNNSYLADISDDGSKLLFATTRARLEKRPTTLFSYHIMDLASGAVETVVKDDGFLSSGAFSPDGNKILFTGSGESFNSLGAEVKKGQIPNGYHILAYVMDIRTKKVISLSKGFKPSVSSAEWSRADGRIYLRVEEKDRSCIYSVSPDGKGMKKMNTENDYVSSMDLATASPLLAYRARGLESADAAYILDTRKSGVSTTVCNLTSERLGDVRLGKGNEYEFTSSRGDRINCFYVLPAEFDPEKKYPMLVHYYGGCSPSGRYAIGSYSPQYYAAQGYVFLVVNPSGAAGMGQEFAARHVNTAGDVVSDDIIEATENFCKEHLFVDKKHIGCFSASYGGFMTQLLLTKTDIYATGISHAGISDHTSYWGEGYWGYSYSEVSMADSYPWTRKDLYVDRSPLYMADKIHTPILFLHGSKDTNVPIGESIQMFTALKLLGNDTAFVVVDGEDHGIREYNKRRDWLRTISAWFAKYLKEDSSWWDNMYPPKNL